MSIPLGEKIINTIDITEFTKVKIPKGTKGIILAKYTEKGKTLYGVEWDNLTTGHDLANLHIFPTMLRTCNLHAGWVVNEGVIEPYQEEPTGVQGFIVNDPLRNLILRLRNNE